ncbi:hypothetical protein WA158_007816 [Blastocystis sp. Blastoise]
MNTEENKINKEFLESLKNEDPSLLPYADIIYARHNYFEQRKNEILGGNSIVEFSSSFKYYGFNRYQKNGEAGIVFRDWAPRAKSMSLVGDFNFWNTKAYPFLSFFYYICTKLPNGDFEIYLPDINGLPRIQHNQRIKVYIVDANDNGLYRIPAYINRSVHDWDGNKQLPAYTGIYWNPSSWEQYSFKYNGPEPQNITKKGIKVYECHIGISSEEETIASYDYFTDHVIQRIKEQGYNAVQIMGIAEHPYYGSFGYHVTSFYAPSSRFGTPEQFMRLVDTCHKEGLIVLMDIVHSHGCSNVGEGLNLYDGSDLYFHHGPRGDHPLWGSKLFNYHETNVVRYLLSNLNYYVSVFHIDGFRFDGITSILYTHHGANFGFSGDYHEYYNNSVDLDAYVYLCLACSLIKEISPAGISIAEDVSGYPQLASDIRGGGLGFDYRMAMAIPDIYIWTKLMEKGTVGKWDVGNILYTLTNRRHQERYIAYTECHDQALVGSKTIAFWLMDKEMYTSMSVLSPYNQIVDQGIALHKCIHLLTFSLGGEGYLNFEGNEFGHPEWLDFPREGNGDSYKYCRRQWSLCDDPLLRYKFLNRWDRDVNSLQDLYNVMTGSREYIYIQDTESQIIAYEKGPLLFIYNLHPHLSQTDYQFTVHLPGKYKCILSSDDAPFGGKDRVDHNTDHFTQYIQEQHTLFVYIPALTASVYRNMDIPLEF